MLPVTGGAVPCGRHGLLLSASLLLLLIPRLGLLWVQSGWASCLAPSVAIWRLPVIVWGWWRQRSSRTWPRGGCRLYVCLRLSCMWLPLACVPASLARRGQHAQGLAVAAAASAARAGGSRRLALASGASLEEQAPQAALGRPFHQAPGQRRNCNLPGAGASSLGISDIPIVRNASKGLALPCGRVLSGVCATFGLAGSHRVLGTKPEQG